jgi:hypothetical protein
MQMTASRKLFSILILIGSSQTIGLAQTTSSACGSQPFCAETNDFVATVTSFRVSTNNVYQQKIIDATVRFQNQTDKPLVLGYVDHSGVAMDDRGNRSVPWGPNAYRGIGLVTGNAFEPKLVLRPGGWGEAQFELVQQGTPKEIGSTYALDLTIDEINTTGNQHTLGGEFPLHFQGLSNGSAGGTLTSATAGGPCGVAGAQGAAGKASSAASTAANTLSNLGSLFGKKKTAQNAGQVANAAAGCDPRVNSVATVAGTVAGAVAGPNAQQTATAPNTQTPQVQQATPPTSSNAGMQQVATTQQTNTQPAGTTGNTPANLAADAYSKTKQAQSRGQQQQQKLPQPAPASAQVAPAQLATAQPAAGISNRQAASSAEPWTPPADNAAKAADLVDPLKLPEVAKMPDVIGVRLGMTEQQALQILHGQYPRGRFQEIPAGGIFPTNPKADYGFNILPTNEIATDVVVSLTAPPSRQVVWHIVRFTRRLHANHANVLATLREKYGKESFAGRANGSKTTDDRNIGTLFWIFDEQGNRAPMPSAEAFGSNDINFCLGNGIAVNPGPRIPMDEVKDPNWCASFVGVVAQIDPNEIVENTTVAVMDMRLANRTANAYVAWKHDADAKARAAELEKSKKNKPVF